MKTIFLVITINSFILSSFAGGIDNSQHSRDINMIFSPPQLIQHDEFLRVSLDQATSYLNDPCHPSLPVWSKSLYFPFGTLIDDVVLSHTGIKELDISKPIQLSSRPLPLRIDEVNSIKPNNEQGYTGNTPYPSQWYTIHTGGGIKDGKRVTILTIHVTPTRYVPDTHVLQYIDNISLKIKYHPSTRTQSGEGPQLVIITPLYYYPELNTLMEHKNNMGLSTTVVTLDEIFKGNYFSVQGRDDQEKIKFFIKHTIENWNTKYILLVGGAQDIPVRQSYISSIMPPETSFPSDLYYADIYDSKGDFSSWDSNNNNFFGEYHYQNRTDKVDLYPDVYFGRLACESVNQVSTVITKIIQYEKETYGKPWFNNIVVCAGDTFPYDSGMINEGEYATREVVDIMSNFSSEKLWASVGNLNKKDILSAINSGAGFVDFSGHGSDIKWKTYPPNNLDELIEFDIYDVALLRNREKLPIVTINACSCGRFDQGTCIAWHFLKKINGGSIATLASSGIAYGIEGSSQTERYSGWMETHFYEYYQKSCIPHNLGIIWSQTITEYLNRFTPSDADYKTVEEWTLFGDPSLTIGGYQNNNAIVCEISKPLRGYIYSHDKELRSRLLGQTLIFGGITLTVDVTPHIRKVEFYVDDTLKHTDTLAPFEYKWDDQAFFLYKLTIIGYTDTGDTISDSLDVHIFNFQTQK